MYRGLAGLRAGPCTFSPKRHMTTPYANSRGTPFWRALAAAVTKLHATGEIGATGTGYVIGYPCKELLARERASTQAALKE